MCEFFMKDLVKKAGLENQFEIASAATSTEELGCSVYPPARRIMAAHGIQCQGKTARQVTRQDYARYDMLICMDQRNLRYLDRILGGDPDEKVSLLLEHAGHCRDVADPYYSGDFQATWDDVVEGCTALLEQLR